MKRKGGGKRGRRLNTKRRRNVEKEGGRVKGEDRRNRRRRLGFKEEGRETGEWQKRGKDSKLGERELRKRQEEIIGRRG